MRISLSELLKVQAKIERDLSSTKAVASALN